MRNLRRILNMTKDEIGNDTIRAKSGAAPSLHYIPHPETTIWLAVLHVYRQTVYHKQTDKKHSHQDL